MTLTQAQRDGLLHELSEDYLRRSGWWSSLETRQACDTSGPCPWFTYSATRYLAGIVRPSYRVFEYGSGNSSRWWASRAAEVVSVEHDPLWAEHLRSDKPQNVVVVEKHMDEPTAFQHSQILLSQYPHASMAARLSSDPTRNYRAGLLDDCFHAYASVLLEFPQQYFDVVVVDGMARVLTTWVAVRQLGPEGVIVFDNSDRDEYQSAYDYLRAQGFVRLDFWGLGPINRYEWCTSIFTRSLCSLQA